MLGFLRPVAGIIVQKGDRYLLVKKPRKDHAWQFPQGGKEEDETLLEAAMRELREECGETLKVSFFAGKKQTYRYLFPADFHRDDRFRGASVSFFMAHYDSGNVTLDPRELIDSVWVTASQLKDYTDPAYFYFLKKMLR